MAPVNDNDPTEVTEFLKRVEESVLTTGRKVADAVEEYLPADAPARKVVDAAFDFTGKLLSLQRDFVEEILQVVTSPSREAGTPTTKSTSPKKDASAA